MVESYGAMSLPVVQVAEDDEGPEEGEIEDDEDDIILVEGSSPQHSSTTSASLDVYPAPSRKESYERDIRNFELRRARTTRLRRPSGGSKSPYIISPSLHGTDSYTRTKTKQCRSGLTQGKENRHVRHKSPVHRKGSHDRTLADFKDKSPTRDSSCSSIDSEERSSDRNSHHRPLRRHRHDRAKRRASSSPESSYIPAKRRSRQSHHSTKCPLIKVLHSVAKETRLIALESSENHSESSSLRQRLFNMGAMPALHDEMPSKNESVQSSGDVGNESRSSSVNSSKPEDSCKQLLSESTQTDEIIEEITPVIKPDPEVVTLTDSEDGAISARAHTPLDTTVPGCERPTEKSNAAFDINPDSLLRNNSDDNDDDIGHLRLLALQSKKQEQQEPTPPPDDGDVLELRLAALKTAFMKKFKTRKKLPVTSRTSKEDPLFPLEDIPLPFSPASPDEVITPVDMELAETDDEDETSLHSMSHYSPSDPIPDCYSPSDDPYPDCYSPSDPTGSPILERSLQELLPPPPPPDFDLFFPDPTYETPLQGISIDNNYAGCYMDHIPSTEMSAPPLPAYFRELLSGMSEDSSTLLPPHSTQLDQPGNVCLVDPFYQPQTLDQSEGSPTDMQKDMPILVCDEVSPLLLHSDPVVKHLEAEAPLVQESSSQAENLTAELLVANEEEKFESQSNCSGNTELKEIVPVLEEKEERVLNDLPALSCDEQSKPEKQLKTVESYEENSQTVPSYAEQSKETPLEEEEKMLRQRLLFNLANKRAKMMEAKQAKTVEAPPSKKNVLPDAVPNRSNLILLHPRKNVNPDKSIKKPANSASEPCRPLLVEAAQKKPLLLVEQSKPKSNLNLLDPSKLKSTPKLVEPLKPKSTQKLVVPIKSKPTQKLIEPTKLKPSHLLPEQSKSKPHHIGISSQMSEEKRFIIHLGEDSDSNEDYSEAEALGRKCARNKEKWILHLKELEVNPTIKGLPISGAKVPLKSNLNTKQAVKERNPKKPFAENLADLENSVERFLKGVRNSHESRAGNLSSTSTSTPVAVKHLPVSQQEEYRRLKQQIAQLEKQREISTRQQKQTLVSVSKGTQVKVASSLNSSKQATVTPKVTALPSSKSSNVPLAASSAKTDLLKNDTHVKAKISKVPIISTSTVTQKQAVTAPAPLTSKIVKLNNINNLAQKSSTASVNGLSSKGAIDTNAKSDIKGCLPPSQLKPNNFVAAEVPENKEGLFSLQSTLVTERSHVLKELSSLAKLLAQVDKSLEAQSHTATEVSSLIDQLCLAAGRWKAQNRTVASLVQKVAQRQRVLSTRHRSCVEASKTCAQLGNQLYGKSYRIPLDKADSMRLQLKQVHEKTQELATRRTTEQAKKHTLEKRAESCLIKLFSDSQNSLVDKGVVKTSGPSSVPSSPTKICKQGKLNAPTQSILVLSSKNKIESSKTEGTSTVSKSETTPAVSSEISPTTTNPLPQLNSAITSRAVSCRLALNKVRSAKSVLNCAGKKRLLEKKGKKSLKQLGFSSRVANQDLQFKGDSDMDISTDGEEPGKKSKEICGNTDVIDMSVSPDTSLSPPVIERESSEPYSFHEIDSNMKVVTALDETKTTSGESLSDKHIIPQVMAKHVPQNQIISSAQTASKNVLKNYISPLGGLSVFSGTRKETTKEGDLYAILCPYDLNGKCQDLECLYKHQHQ